jgi:glycosyltransferase involved in cell wall biosynthesis
MRHLIICREYPPAPSGGIGTYVVNIARLLAARGETVHVIGQRWKGAERPTEEHIEGRLIVHRLPFRPWKGASAGPVSDSLEIKGLSASGYLPQCFGWQASLLAEQLVERHEIDLIEAQEFEAPLYYLQLRRALGLGPDRQPPCLVHLHSPTELIVRHNDWNIYERYWRTAMRLERYTIAAADRLLCPSRFLAREAERHYGVPGDSIVTIPLPAAAIEPVDRDAETWRGGSVLYVGRLERRKGVLEWLEAAVSLARRDSALRFEFVGANILGTGGLSGPDVLRRLIPGELRRRFVFHGRRPYSELPRFLARARLAVVPARWENFPNTCVEAMCSGLPVLASPEGGMREIVEDGRTGWLAASGRPGDLAATLERALSTPPARLAAMGREARAMVQRLCNPEEIVERHLDLRREMVERGPGRSGTLPANLPWSAAPRPASSPRRRAEEEPESGIAVIVTARDAAKSPEKALESIAQQRCKPAAVVVVERASSDARNSAIEGILGSGARPLGFVFLDAETTLDQAALALFQTVLRNCPEVGLVSGWTVHGRTDEHASMPPDPTFPYQWVLNEVASFAAVRTEALLEAGLFRPLSHDAYQAWDLANAVMAAGWVAVTVPAILGRAPVQETAGRLGVFDDRYREMRRSLLSRFPECVARDSPEVVLLTESVMRETCHDQLRRLRRSLSLGRQLVDGPRRLVRRVARKLKREVQRLAARRQASRK